MATIDIPVRSPVDFHLPTELAGLYEMAHNLWWTWNPDARRLFAMIHRWAWERYQTPVEVLLAIEKAEWESLLDNATFMADYAAVHRTFREYLEGTTGGSPDGREGRSSSWFSQRFPDSERAPIGYFSMEYGLHQSLPLYSGGLGVLSADHLKSASDLGVPFVAVGLAYRLGYFRQTIDAEGVQQHAYLENDFVRLGLRPVVGPTGSDLVVHVPFPDREVAAKVWALVVGRVPLLLLDTDSRLNMPADRAITSVLYTRGREMRLAQEVVLGVGGARALLALGIEPSVWHLNEGHSALMQLERLRQKVVAEGRSWQEALSGIRANTAFTTHTPVVAGHETYDAELATRYLEPWVESLAQPISTVFELGSARDPDSGDSGDSGDPAAPESLEQGSFNLTALGFKTSTYINGVSQLNAKVIDPSWRHLRPEVPEGVAVVQPITNGVHLPTWLGGEVAVTLNRSLGADWAKAPCIDPKAAAAELDTEDLWRAHLAQKSRLARFLRERLLRQYSRHGRSPARLRSLDSLFDVDVLTIGFARRFATYKRADLLFSDLERVRALLLDSQRPIQVILAGKAHPADRPGQELIRRVFELSQDEALRGRVVFVENYDLEVGLRLVQGVDVWLNTPRKPLEASGTSGMKAALNGILNLSVLDGWWPEAFDGLNGWAIDGGEHSDEDSQDLGDADSLYSLLEDEVAPLYYRRDSEGLPVEWIERMKRSILTVAAPFSSDRMVRDYVEQAYAPLSGPTTEASASEISPPRDLLGAPVERGRSQ